MRNHFSSVVTLAVALLFVSGTIGCRSNGGAWYNPKSYTWTNPFVKSNEAPAYNAANPRPSLDSEPDIDRPQGGYTDGTSSYASRTNTQQGMTDTSSSNQGRTANPATQGTTNPYSGGYSVAETSAYPPPYAGAQQQVAETSTANQYQYPASSTQTNPTQSPYTPAAPLGNSPYTSSDYAAGSTGQYQQTSAGNYPPATPNYASDPYAATTPPATAVASNPGAAGGNYAPFETTTPTTPQNDPYAVPAQQAPIQQPASATPATGYYDQSVGAQPASTYPPAGNFPGQSGQTTPAPAVNSTVPATSPYQQQYQSSQPTSNYGY